MKNNTEVVYHHETYLKRNARWTSSSWKKMILNSNMIASISVQVYFFFLYGKIPHKTEIKDSIPRPGLTDGGFRPSKVSARDLHASYTDLNFSLCQCQLWSGPLFTAHCPSPTPTTSGSTTFLKPVLRDGTCRHALA